MAFALAGSGCITDELLQSHVEPGGTIVSAIGAAPQHTCPALLDATADPITLNGFSATMTFGLVGALDVGGANVHTELATSPTAVVLQIAPGSTNQLQVHADGGGCAAVTATIHLQLDGSGLAQGDFTVESGHDTEAGAPCVFSGLITNVPVSR